MVNNSPAYAGDAGSIPEPAWKDPFAGSKWQPTLVFLIGKSHGQKELRGYRP